MFQSYQLLIQLLPALEKVLIDVDPMKISNYISQVCLLDYCAWLGSLIYYCQLQRGASEARGDDVRRIKREVAVWLNEVYTPNPAFTPNSRASCGFENDITGFLLCPIQYNWADLACVPRFVSLLPGFMLTMISCSTRAKIREGDEEFIVTTDIFLNCLYPKSFTANFSTERDFEKGFLRSALLIKVCNDHLGLLISNVF